MRFQALDSWRGIAAVGVVSFHMPIAWSFYDAALVRNAWLAVDFFFVLSGFVMAYTYSTRITDRRLVVDFMIKRFGRVWPLHALVVVGLVLLQIAILMLTRYGHFPAPNTAPFEGPWRLNSIVPNLLLVHALGLMPGPGTWNTPSWSISVEFFTYVVFAFAVLFGRHRLVLMSALISLGGLAVLVLYSKSYLGSTTTWGFARCLYGFFLGVILFRIEALVPSMSAPAASGLEGLMVAVVLVFVWRVGATPFTFLAPPLFAALILVFARQAGAISQVLKTKPFAWLGEHSYTIYMLHLSFFIVLNYAMRAAEHLFHRSFTTTYLLPEGFDNPDLITAHTALTFGSMIANDIACLLVLAAITLAASIIHHRFEVPTRDWFKKFAMRSGGPPSGVLRAGGRI